MPVIEEEKLPKAKRIRSIESIIDGSEH